MSTTPPFDRDAFRAWLKLQGKKPATAHSYVSRVGRLIAAGASLVHPPAGADADERSAWRAYVAWCSERDAGANGSSLRQAALTAAIDYRVQAQHHPSFVALHLEAVGAFKRGATWAEVALALRAPYTGVWEAYVRAQPWLKREHAKRGIEIEIPPYDVPDVPIDNDVAYLANAFTRAEHPNPHDVRWSDLKPLRGEGLLAMKLGTYQIGGSALYAMAKRQSAVDPDALLLGTVQTRELVVVDRDGFPLSRTVWDDHVAAGRGGVMAATKLPNRLIAILNPPRPAQYDIADAPKRTPEQIADFRAGLEARREARRAEADVGRPIWWGPETLDGADGDE